MITGYRIESVIQRSGAVYVLAYLPANQDYAMLVEDWQASIDPGRKRKIVRAVPIVSDAPPTGA